MPSTVVADSAARAAARSAHHGRGVVRWCAERTLRRERHERSELDTRPDALIVRKLNEIFYDVEAEQYDERHPEVIEGDARVVDLSGREAGRAS